MTARCSTMLIHHARGPRPCCREAGHIGACLTAVDMAILTTMDKEHRDRFKSKRARQQRRREERAA